MALLIKGLDINSSDDVSASRVSHLEEVAEHTTQELILIKNMLSLYLNETQYTVAEALNKVLEEADIDMAFTDLVANESAPQ